MIIESPSVARASMWRPGRGRRSRYWPGRGQYQQHPRSDAQPECSRDTRAHVIMMVTGSHFTVPVTPAPAGPWPRRRRREARTYIWTATRDTSLAVRACSDSESHSVRHEFKFRCQ
jgi:hypothetical protein